MIQVYLPSSNHGFNDFKHEVDKLSDILSVFCPDFDAIVMGDCNARLLRKKLITDLGHITTIFTTLLILLISLQSLKKNSTWVQHIYSFRIVMLLHRQCVVVRKLVEKMKYMYNFTKIWSLPG